VWDRQGDFFLQCINMRMRRWGVELPTWSFPQLGATNRGISSSAPSEFNKITHSRLTNMFPCGFASITQLDGCALFCLAELMQCILLQGFSACHQIFIKFFPKESQKKMCWRKSSPTPKELAHLYYTWIAQGLTCSKARENQLGRNPKLAWPDSTS
jgi:hypothetical protein